MSRGASRALVFDRDPKAVRQCSVLMSKLGISNEVRVRKGNVPKCLPESGAYDIVFVDPPYALDATSVLEAIGPICKGVIVLEHRSDSPTPNGLTRVDERQYGETKLSFYRASDELQKHDS